MTVSQNINRFCPGQEITGRWDGNRYTVERELGSGGTARVLLVKNTANGKVSAMKISRDLPGITREHRTLLFLNNNREIKNLGILPGVYELDDYCEDGITYHYIIMDYCPGKGLGELKGRLQPADIAKIGLVLAIFLHHLHKAGYIFADLKPGNILYDPGAQRLSVVDFGSVCPKGSSIRQYTPLYDRRNWQAGARYGDERYDLFALSMLLLSLHPGMSKYLKGGSITELLNKLRPLTAGYRLMPVIIRGLRQEFSLSGEMAAELWQRRGTGRETWKTWGPVNAGGNDMYWPVGLAGAFSAFLFVLSIFYYYQ